MRYVGIDLHSKSIMLCVMGKDFQVIIERRLDCKDLEGIKRFFAELGAFQAVVEATASYEWLWQLLEPLADRLVLAHPKKLRIIAESTRKSDRLDARVLAEFLARGMIPEAYRPTPRQRAHRLLVRQRVYVQRRSSAARIKIRRLLANYNADRKDLFTKAGQKYLAQLALPESDRFVIEQLVAEWHHHAQQVRDITKRLWVFAQQAPTAEAEARQSLRTIPGVGPVTIDVVVSEVADVRRFRSQKQVVAYAGLAPGQRESAGKRQELGITKEGSRLLRWALVEAAWRLVRRSVRWGRIYEALQQRRGKKKAIVAIARRLLGVMVAVWRSGQRYRLAT